MDAARLHHFSMLLIGLSLGINGFVTVRTGGGSDVGGVAMAAGGVLMAGVSVYSLVTDATSGVGRRVAMVTAFGAVLAVSGTVLMLFA
ncbi:MULTISPECIES: hypothetical protein [Haloarcula]|uniref:Uncharacterized protein n=2 Tax=Haloarcula sebkhae TaxID=932660 RepID=A0A830EF45_9EURY|nr:hypothetical protein [Haloarcula sebkhae]GGK54255.1 hypothetical protein GCM10009067_03510 [Haloarcula sebkhae]